MFEIFRNAWKIAELRKKILFTIFIVMIFRLGSHIFVPFLEADAIGKMLGGDGTLMQYFDAITGGALGKGTLFAMSITPYINASIIMQLLTVAIPVLERLSKEGDEGRKKINKITKFVALGIGLFQSAAFYFGLLRIDAVKYTEGFDGFITMITIIGCFVAGASLIIWLGDQISDKGIGNGISMILFAGIISRVPEEIVGLFRQITTGKPQNVVFVPLILVIYILMIALVVTMSNAERRIPVQYAKRQVGRKMYGGQSSHIPIKVAMSGVMPIIFAMSIMSLPQTILYFFGIDNQSTGFWGNFVRTFNSSSWVYAALYFVLIIAFNYFYVAIQYNPVEIANNLKKNNGAIPGYRPGKPTSDFIHNSLSKVTFIGAIFLGFVAIFPIAFSKVTGLQGLSLGGTTVLIVVSVALETMRTLESQMMMRHHKGFLE
ncbi:MAG: preprotein translocase subunit SecY [Oscillospiraceae bacterium]|jgi:preprotein translocase subunit SecY|nr:preprotein translocase subunit SecY [Oscillospiraceae bacterium]